MHKHLLYLSVFLFFACSSSNTEDASLQKDSATTSVQDTVTVPTAGDTSPQGIDWDKPDSLKIAKLKEYTASWDNSYFPLPDIAILKRYSQTDLGYLYLIHNFDSLDTKRTTEYYETRGEEEELNTNPCAWEQRFKPDIFYSTNDCGENSEEITIHTKCPDKKVLVRLIDILYHDATYTWDSDSSTYQSIDEDEGSFYKIEKNEEGGYDIECQYYYGGC